jgi:hypothetical protein
MTSTLRITNAPGMHRGIGALVAGARVRQPVLLVS